MKGQFHYPFSKLSFEEWQNLGILAVLAFYLVLIGRVVITNRPVCEIDVVAGDYCAFWSAGKVASNFGYSKIYDLDLLSQYQKTNSGLPNGGSTFRTLAIVFLPIFVTPFQPLSLLDVTSGFWLWTLLNLVGFVLYLRFFYKNLTGNQLLIKTVILLAISFQVFMNLYLGQVNIWFVICVGEFLRLIMMGKNFQAGIWLGGLLLKPQLLIIIIPVILFKRWKSVFIGFCFSLFWVLLISFGLAQKEGLLSLFTLLLGHAQSITPTGTEIMMNWRMMGLNLSSLFDPAIGLLVALIGSITTIIAIVYIWKKSANTNPEVFVICILATFAATGALTWHAHLTMSLVLIPPMVYLYANKQLPDRVISWWVFMPIFIWFIRYIVGALIALRIMQFSAVWFMDFLYGLSGLSLNLLLVFWAMVKIRQLSVGGAEKYTRPIVKMIVTN
jgi:hypothetical protein